jgi:hypothetical protein
VRGTWQVSSLSHTILHCIGRIIVKSVAMGRKRFNQIGTVPGRPDMT